MLVCNVHREELTICKVSWPLHPSLESHYWWHVSEEQDWCLSLLVSLAGCCCFWDHLSHLQNPPHPQAGHSPYTVL